MKNASATSERRNMEERIRLVPKTSSTRKNTIANRSRSKQRIKQARWRSKDQGKLAYHFNSINKLAQQRDLMRSKDIDQTLLSDQESRKKEIHILIIGGSGVGKSTLVKQFRIHYGDAFPDEKRLELVEQIMENLTDAIHIVLANMKTRDSWFHDPYIQEMAKEFVTFCPKFNESLFKNAHETMDIENSIHYAHVEYADDDAFCSTPSESETQSLLANQQGAHHVRKMLELKIDGILVGCEIHDTTSPESLIFYYNTLPEESEADTPQEEKVEENLYRPFVSTLNFKKLAQHQHRLTEKISDSRLQLEESESIASEDVDSNTDELLFVYERNDIASQFIRHIKNLIVQAEFELCLEDYEYFKPEITYAELYFIQHVDRIIQDDYVPTLQDILAIRKPTSAVRETEFAIAGTVIRMIDLAGQINHKNKWIHYFEDVNAVMFVSALSGFSELIEEADRTIIKMTECMRIFNDVINSKYFWKKDFFIFLNKLDVFEQKLKKRSITGLFPDYRGHDEVNQCAQYIKEKFLSMIPKNLPKSKKVYTHLTSATDIDKMKNIFKESLQRVFEANSKKAVTLL